MGEEGATNREGREREGKMRGREGRERDGREGPPQNILA